MNRNAQLAACTPCDLTRSCRVSLATTDYCRVTCLQRGKSLLSIYTFIEFYKGEIISFRMLIELILPPDHSMNEPIEY